MDAFKTKQQAGTTNLILLQLWDYGTQWCKFNSNNLEVVALYQNLQKLNDILQEKER